MGPSDIGAVQLAQIQQTIGIAVLKSAQSTETAQAISLIEGLQTSQPAIQQALHPTLGKHLDISI